MEALKPCPTCGGKAEYDGACDLVRVQCSEDNCLMATLWFDEPEDAAQAWNTRPIEDALRARIAQLEGERKDCFLVTVHDYARLTASYDQAHSAGANLGYGNAKADYEGRIAELEGVLIRLRESKPGGVYFQKWEAEIDSALQAAGYGRE